MSAASIVYNQSANVGRSFISYCKPRKHQQVLEFLKATISQLRPDLQKMDPDMLRDIHNSVAHVHDVSSQAGPKRFALQNCSDEEILERCNNASQLGLLFETV